MMTKKRLIVDTFLFQRRMHLCNLQACASPETELGMLVAPRLKWLWYVARFVGIHVVNYHWYHLLFTRKNVNRETKRLTRRLNFNCDGTNQRIGANLITMVVP